MSETDLVVTEWPAMPADLNRDLLILAIRTPRGAPRAVARQQVRQVLRQTLAPRLGCPAADVPLLSPAGQAIRLAGSDHGIGLSISHEEGLSLLAIRFSGPVGIDLLATTVLQAVQDDLLRLANDYLDPTTAAAIAALPPAQRGMAFGEAWVRLEARLKCLGYGIDEWRPAWQARLQPCTSRLLDLPAGFIGALAWPT